MGGGNGLEGKHRFYPRLHKVHGGYISVSFINPLIALSLMCLLSHNHN